MYFNSRLSWWHVRCFLNILLLAGTDQRQTVSIRLATIFIIADRFCPLGWFLTFCSLFGSPKENTNLFEQYLFLWRGACRCDEVGGGTMGMVGAGKANRLFRDGG